MKKKIVIAEMANSHEGKFSIAYEIIKQLTKSNVDAIKFQLFTADELLAKMHSEFNHYKKLEMKKEEWQKLVKYAKSKKMKVYFDIFGLKSAKIAKELGADGYKIHLSDITNPNLLEYVGSLKKPILLSTAGAKEFEIHKAIEKLHSKKITLMHGYQGFPTKTHDLNLKRLNELKLKFGLPIGIMDHVDGNSNISQIIPLLAIVFDVQIIEKHITLSRENKGIDYFSSLTPLEFQNFVDLIKKSTLSLGKREIQFSEDEFRYRLKHKKKTIAKTKLKKNTIIKKSDLEYKRVDKEIESLSYYDLIGKRIIQNIEKEEILTEKVIETKYKIAAIIACRNDSDRMYGKPLQKLGKYTILHHLINQLKTSKRINEIVLAISENPGNEIFIDFAKKNKLKFVIGDDRNVLQRLIIGAKTVDANIVFRVTSENPYIFWEGIDQLIESHLKLNSDFTFYDKLPIGSSFEIINLQSLEKSHKNGSDKHRSELCSLYIRENQKKFNINKIQPPKLVAKPNIRLTVDTPEDLILSRLIYKRLGKRDRPIKLQNILKFLEQNSNLIKINSSIPLGVTRIWY